MDTRIVFKSSTPPSGEPPRGAQRYYIVRFWVDAFDRKPTWDEVRAAPDNTPVPQPESLPDNLPALMEARRKAAWKDSLAKVEVVPDIPTRTALRSITKLLEA